MVIYSLNEILVVITLAILEFYRLIVRSCTGKYWHRSLCFLFYFSSNRLVVHRCEDDASAGAVDVDRDLPLPLPLSVCNGGSGIRSEFGDGNMRWSIAR